jgi:hypothetical protein
MQRLVHLRSWAYFVPRRVSPLRSVTMTSSFSLYFIFTHSQTLAANLKIGDIVYELQQNWFYTWLLHLPTNLFWWSPTSLLPNFTVDKIPFRLWAMRKKGKSETIVLSFDWSCLANRRIHSAWLDGGWTDCQERQLAPWLLRILIGMTDIKVLIASVASCEHKKGPSLKKQKEHVPMARWLIWQISTHEKMSILALHVIHEEPGPSLRIWGPVRNLIWGPKNGKFKQPENTKWCSFKKIWSLVFRIKLRFIHNKSRCQEHHFEMMYWRTASSLLLLYKSLYAFQKKNPIYFLFDITFDWDWGLFNK